MSYGHMSLVFQMHESNAYLLYRPELAFQIPPSYAAHAFSILRHSVLLAELVKLCALWDDPDLDTATHLWPIATLQGSD